MKNTPSDLIEAAKKIWPEVAELKYSDIEKSQPSSRRCYVILHFNSYCLHISQTPSKTYWQVSKIFDDRQIPAQGVEAATPEQACEQLDQILRSKS